MCRVCVVCVTSDTYKGRKDVGDMLAKLTQDRDRDVRYYASSAIHADQKDEEGAVSQP